MATRRITVAVLIGCGILTAWRLSGVLLVRPSTGGVASILAAGPLPILAHIWSALVAAAALAILMLSGVIDRTTRLAADADHVHQLHNLHDDIQLINTERERLRQARQIIEDKERAYEDRKHTDDVRIRSVITTMAQQEQETNRLHRELDKIKGELTGARDHIRRLKAKMVIE